MQQANVATVVCDDNNYIFHPMRLSFNATVPCYFLQFFIVSTLCSISSSALSNDGAAHQEEQHYSSDLIAMDLIKVTDQDTTASFNCWISAVESLLSDGLTEPITSFTADCPYSCHQHEEHQQQSLITSCSPGTSFCSGLTNIQKKALALQLTKCYLEESNRFISMPESCQMENTSLGGRNSTTSNTSSKQREDSSMSF